MQREYRSKSNGSFEQHSAQRCENVQHLICIHVSEQKLLFVSNTWAYTCVYMCKNAQKHDKFWPWQTELLKAEYRMHLQQYQEARSIAAGCYEQQ